MARTSLPKLNLAFGSVRQLSLDVIIEPTQAVRTTIDPIELDDLARALRSSGQIQPIIVRPTGNSYEIVVGHRRFLATQQNKQATISAIVREISDEDAFTMRLVENSARADVHPIDEANYLESYLQLFQITQEELAKRLGRSTAWISQRLAIARYPDALRTALQHDQITFSVARELSKIDDLHTLIPFLDSAISGGCTPAQARAWVADWKHYKEYHPNDESPGTPPATYDLPEPVVLKCAICGEVGKAAVMKNLWVDRECFNAAIDALISLTSPPEAKGGGPGPEDT